MNRQLYNLGQIVQRSFGDVVLFIYKDGVRFHEVKNNTLEVVQNKMSSKLSTPIQTDDKCDEQP